MWDHPECLVGLDVRLICRIFEYGMYFLQFNAVTSVCQQCLQSCDLERQQKESRMDMHGQYWPRLSQSTFSFFNALSCSSFSLTQWANLQHPHYQRVLLCPGYMAKQSDQQSTRVAAILPVYTGNIWEEFRPKMFQIGLFQHERSSELHPSPDQRDLSAEPTTITWQMRVNLDLNGEIQVVGICCLVSWSSSTKVQHSTASWEKKIQRAESLRHFSELWRWRFRI